MRETTKRLDPRRIGRWSLFLAFLAVGMTGLSWLFLRGLETVARVREDSPWLLLFLPATGWLTAWTYRRFGRGTEAGNNRILSEIREPTAPIPGRMAPMILVSTLATHLFGGSAGREGTALQMGASLAETCAGWVRLGREARPRILAMGMAAGFSGVFGTPWAGTVFALEVVQVGKLRWRDAVPCALAAWATWWAAEPLGLAHFHWPVEIPGPGLRSLGAVLALGLASGAIARAFSWAVAGFGQLYGRLGFHGRPILSGCLVAGAAGLVGTRWLGLGTNLIAASFEGGARAWDAPVKLLFTAATVAGGFKGGEVTPLFSMGATAGASLAPWLASPSAWCAAVGFVAVFAGAARTPLACAAMAAEVFGPGTGLWALPACLLAAGTPGPVLYSAQRAVPGLARWLRTPV